MTKKQTEDSAQNPQPQQSTDATTAPVLSDDLLKELAKHTEANRKATNDEVPAPEASEPAQNAHNLPMIIEPTHEQPTSSADPQDDADDDPLADDKTDAAVDEIVKEEGDEVLAAEDAAREPAPTALERRGFWRTIGHFFVAWWHNKWARNITIVLILAAIAAIVAFPQTRYYMLNKAGVRSSVSLSVVDNGTRLPLKNVTVSLDGYTAKTDSKGIAKIEKVPLGKHQLVISRIAFAPIKQPVVIGWGSNPLGDFILTPTGARYEIKVSDYISGKPITGAEATTADESVTAVTDKKGIATLTFDKPDSSTTDIIIHAKDYRDSKDVLHMDTTAQISTVMVPAQKTVFVSKQSGKYDLLSMYVDGQDKKTILAGTGSENNNLGLVVSPDSKAAALVSTRDNQRDKDGFLLSTLTVVDVDNSLPITVTHAAQIQLVTWTGNQLVFIETSAGASAANPNRYRLIAYDYTTNKRTIVATANQFNGVSYIDNYVYYAVSSTDPNAQAKFYRSKLDATGKQTVLDQEVWTVIRNSFNTLQLQTPTGWVAYNTNTGSIQKTDAPGQYTSRIFALGPKTFSAWVDTRDGQGVLLTHDTANSKDAVIKSQNGLTYPVRWLNSTTLIYRVATNQEVADYAVGSDGGPAKKLTDVSNTFGFAY